MNLGDKDHKEEFEKEVLQRLTRIEAKQEGISGQCEPCQKKISDLEIGLAEIKASAKSAHHRVDSMKNDRIELKNDLTEAIKSQIGGIYRTASMVSGTISFIAGIFMWLASNWRHIA